MSFTTIVTTDELGRHPEWRVFDCRHDLAKPDLGEQQYREAHIPGAVFAHLDRDLAGPKNGRNGRHPLPDPATFIAWLGQQGIDRADHIVAYDGGAGQNAARLWWLLRWVGHETVGILDGNYPKWVAEGRPVTAEIPKLSPTKYPGTPNAEMAVDVAFVESHLNEVALIDARAPARWRGDNEPTDPVAGRIPGSLNRFAKDNQQADGTFKRPEVLRQEFLAVLDGRRAGEVVHSCGSGIAACYNLIAMEVAGLPGGRLYSGSWSEWIADPRRPRASGNS